MLHNIFGRTIMGILAALLLAGCENSETHPPATDDFIEADMALAHVNVVNVIDGTIANNQTIYIKGGLIVAVTKSEATPLYSAQTTIDGHGTFAIPGLWDMHIHLRGAGMEKENELFLSHFTGFGITGVRDAAGDLPDAVAMWAQEITAGTRTGPMILSSIRKLDGPNPTWDGSIAVDSLADIEPALNSLSMHNPDFIKVYTSTLKPELYLPLLQEIEARGLKSSAHLSFAVPFRASVKAGLDSVEHALYLHKAASGRDEELSAALMRGERVSGIFNALLDSEEEAYCTESLHLMREQSTALTPTLYVDHLLRYLDTDDHKSDDRLSLMPLAIQKTYEGRVSSAERRSPAQIAADHRRADATVRLTKAAYETGVILLAGSDTGAFNSYVYPGDSLHREMQSLQDAGLPPLAVLQAATINGARFMERDSTYGSLDVGKVADIVLLAANPLDDIANSRLIEGLIQSGHYRDSNSLKTLRDKALNE